MNDLPPTSLSLLFPSLPILCVCPLLSPNGLKAIKRTDFENINNVRNPTTTESRGTGKVRNINLDCGPPLSSRFFYEILRSQSKKEFRSQAFYHLCGDHGEWAVNPNPYRQGVFRKFKERTHYLKNAWISGFLPQNRLVF